MRISSPACKALKKGSFKRNEVRAMFNGVSVCIPTFEGGLWHATGKLDVWHHGSWVLAVDFDRDLVTDFGYRGYSATTTRVVNGWLWDLQSMNFHYMQSLSPHHDPFEWTWSYAYNKNEKFRGEGWREEMFDRFRKRVPWVKWIDGHPWYSGSHWYTSLDKKYRDMHRDLLKDGGWRWWTGDWTESGLWVKRFIDADAKRRWNALQKRRQRAAARAAAYTSSKGDTP